MPIRVTASGRGIWSARQSTKSFPKRISPPKTLPEWTPPPALPSPKRTPTGLDADSAAELLVRVESWLKQADEIEEKARTNKVPDTLEDRIARLMFEIDVPLKM